MAKKKLPTTPEELKGASADVFEVLKAESDRGCVLVAAAFVEEGLELLLRSRMLTDPKVEFPGFNGHNLGFVVQPLRIPRD